MANAPARETLEWFRVLCRDGMTETPRDRVWVAALALARLEGTFAVDDVLATADLPEDDREVAGAVLRTMERYGFLAADGDRWRAGRTVPATGAGATGFDGTFTHLVAPNERWTFAPAPVRDWLETRLEGRVLNLFAGGTRLDHDGEVVRNDLDESVEADRHVDARRAASHFAPGSFDTVVLDPPLAQWRADEGQASDHAGGVVQVMNQVAGLVPVGGRTVVFGRSSSGMGATRGFETEELCLIDHPGEFHDTVAVVERRTRETSLRLPGDG